MHSGWLWKIKHGDDNALEAVKILGMMSIPATYEQIALVLGRMMAHFPGRDPAKDAIVISDISGAAERSGVSAVAAIAVCEKLWQESDSGNPFKTPSGEILKRMKDQTDIYITRAEAILEPVRNRPVKREQDIPAWVREKESMSDSVREEFREFLSNIPEAVGKSYCEAYKFDYDKYRY